MLKLKENEIRSYVTVVPEELADFSDSEFNDVKKSGYYECKIRFMVKRQISDKLKQRLREIKRTGRISAERP